MMTWFLIQCSGLGVYTAIMFFGPKDNIAYSILAGMFSFLSLICFTMGLFKVKFGTFKFWKFKG